jgi:hypothetical protein
MVQQEAKIIVIAAAFDVRRMVIPSPTPDLGDGYHAPTSSPLGPPVQFDSESLRDRNGSLIRARPRAAMNTPKKMAPDSAGAIP